MTSAYYAKRYFGASQEAAVNSMMWTQLKKFGLVNAERLDGPDEPPTWRPSYQASRWAVVERHKEERCDLSALVWAKQHAPEIFHPLPEPVFETARQPQHEMTPSPPPTEDEAPPEAVPMSASLKQLVDESMALLSEMIEKEPGRSTSHYSSKLPSDRHRLAAPTALSKLKEIGAVGKVKSLSGGYEWLSLSGELPEPVVVKRAKRTGAVSTPDFETK